MFFSLAKIASGENRAIKKIIVSSLFIAEPPLVRNESRETRVEASVSQNSNSSTSSQQARIGKNF
jgi:hypothetical protein